MNRLLDTATFGPKRRRRQMLRRLRDLDRADAATGRASFGFGMPARRRNWGPLVLVLVVALIGGGIYSWVRFGPGKAGDQQLASGLGGGGSAASPVPSGSASPDPAESVRAVPPPGVGELPKPIGHPAAAPAGAGGYAFELTQAGSLTAPVSWDPCRPIHYVVSGTAPAGAEQFVTQSVAEISRATGLRFITDGPTTEQPTSAVRPSYQPKRYGKRWAPLLIAWTSPAQEADLAGSIIGLGGSSPMSSEDNRLTYVTGRVSLDAPQIGEQLAQGGPAAGPVMRAVVLHELGHAMGLAHVTDSSQVMYPEGSLQVTDLGAGDLRGLAALGAGTCEPSI